MHVLFFRSCPSYLFPLKIKIWIQAIANPNKLQHHPLVVLRALWSGIVFVLFFASSVFFRHCCALLFDLHEMYTCEKHYI